MGLRILWGTKCEACCVAPQPGRLFCDPSLRPTTDLLRQSLAPYVHCWDWLADSRLLHVKRPILFLSLLQASSDEGNAHNGGSPASEAGLQVSLSIASLATVLTSMTMTRPSLILSYARPMNVALVTSSSRFVQIVSNMDAVAHQSY